MGPFVVVALVKSLAGTAAIVLVAPVSVTSADAVALAPNENPPNAGVTDGFGVASVLAAPNEPKVAVLLLLFAGPEVPAMEPKPLPNWNGVAGLLNAAAAPNGDVDDADEVAAVDESVFASVFAPNVNDVLPVGLPKTNDDFGSSVVALVAAAPPLPDFGVSQHAHLSTADSFLVMHA